MATDKCIKCGSYAFNLYKEDIDQGGLCDVHYWQYRAHRAEALAEQPAQPQEPVQRYSPDGEGSMEVDSLGAWMKFTSMPAQHTWVWLTDEEKAELDAEHGDDTLAHLDAIEAKLREKNA